MIGRLVHLFASAALLGGGSSWATFPQSAPTLQVVSLTEYLSGNKRPIPGASVDAFGNVHLPPGFEGGYFVIASESPAIRGSGYLRPQVTGGPPAGPIPGPPWITGSSHIPELSTPSVDLGTTANGTVRANESSNFVIVTDRTALDLTVGSDYGSLPTSSDMPSPYTFTTSQTTATHHFDLTAANRSQCLVLLYYTTVTVSGQAKYRLWSKSSATAPVAQSPTSGSATAAVPRLSIFSGSYSQN